MTDNERDITALLERLGDETAAHRLGTLAQLSDLDPDETETFSAEWSFFDPALRRELAQALQELAEASAELDFRAIFVVLTEDEEPVVRMAAARGLIEDTRRSTLSRLLTLLADDPDDSVRAAVASTLGAWTLSAAQGDYDEAMEQRLAKALLAVVHDAAASAEIRRRALEAVAYLGHMPAVQEAIEAADQRPEILWRQSTICAMGRSGQVRWLDTIAAALGSDEPGLRFEAARAAGELGDIAQPLVSGVARIALDGDLEVALAAVWSLGQIGGPSARRLLQQMLQQSEGSRLEAIQEAINELDFYDDPMANIALDDDEDWEDWEEDEE